MPDLSSRTVLLTGALGSLGRAQARAFVTAGADAASPGAVVSEAEARVYGDRAQAYSDWIIAPQCLKSRIQPEAIADLVVFLASPAAAMITGQNIAFDGGW